MSRVTSWAFGPLLLAAACFDPSGAPGDARTPDANGDAPDSSDLPDALPGVATLAPMIHELTMTSRLVPLGARTGAILTFFRIDSDGLTERPVTAMPDGETYGVDLPDGARGVWRIMPPPPLPQVPLFIMVTSSTRSQRVLFDYIGHLDPGATPPSALDVNFSLATPATNNTRVGLHAVGAWTFYDYPAAPATGSTVFFPAEVSYSAFAAGATNYLPQPISTTDVLVGTQYSQSTVGGIEYRTLNGAGAAAPFAQASGTNTVGMTLQPLAGGMNVAFNPPLNLENRITQPAVGAWGKGMQWTVESRAVPTQTHGTVAGPILERASGSGVIPQGQFSLENPFANLNDANTTTLVTSVVGTVLRIPTVTVDAIDKSVILSGHAQALSFTGQFAELEQIDPVDDVRLDDVPLVDDGDTRLVSGQPLAFATTVDDSVTHAVLSCSILSDSGFGFLVPTPAFTADMRRNMQGEFFAVIPPVALPVGPWLVCGVHASRWTAAVEGDDLVRTLPMATFAWAAGVFRFDDGQ